MEEVKKKKRKKKKKKGLGWGNPNFPGAVPSGADGGGGIGESCIRSFVRETLYDFDLEDSLLYSDGEPEEGDITYSGDTRL